MRQRHGANLRGQDQRMAATFDRYVLLSVTVVSSPPRTQPLFSAQLHFRIGLESTQLKRTLLSERHCNSYTSNIYSRSCKSPDRRAASGSVLTRIFHDANHYHYIRLLGRAHRGSLCRDRTVQRGADHKLPYDITSPYQPED